MNDCTTNINQTFIIGSSDGTSGSTIDVYITGGTYSNGVTTFTNSTGGTFNINGFYTGSTDVYITGVTTNNDNRTYIFTNTSGGTFSVNELNNIIVTGGTYSNGSITFTNTSGGTFSVGGFITGDTFASGFTYDNNNNLTLKQNNGVSDLKVLINTMSGLTVTNDSNLKTVTAETISFNTNYTGTTNVGQLTWDNTFGTLQLGMVGGNVIQQVGQEFLAYVYNSEPNTLVDGEVVYIYGAHGDKISVKRASNTGETISSKTFGVVTEQIPSGQNGFVTTQGTINGLNLGGYSSGEQLYLGSSPGTLTNIKPIAPNHLVFIGVVQRANNGNGQLYIKPQNGYELNEIHDALVTGATNGDLLMRNSSNLWVNTKTLIGNYSIGGVLSATTLSATTYLGLPTDVTVTGGTYNNGITTFTNNTGGTFSVSGLPLNLFFSGTGVGSIQSISNNASGVFSFAIGTSTTSSGQYSNSQGLLTTSYGLASHAEGYETLANGTASHVEGYNNVSSGDYSHAEGTNTQSIGIGSHAEGESTTSIGDCSHAEGNATTASGEYSHTEGVLTRSIGVGSHASGYQSISNGDYSFVHGNNSIASVNGSIVLGDNLTGTSSNQVYVNNINLQNITTGTSVSSLGIDSSGKVIKIQSSDTFVTGGTYSGTTATFRNNTGGTFTITGFTEGLWSAGTNTNSILMPSSLNYASGERSLSIGFGSNASGQRSFAGGTSSNATGQMGFAFGLNATAGGYTSLAFGYGVQASNDYTIAMGYNTFASGGNSVSIGGGNSASGYRSFALGYNNISNNDFGYCIGTDGNTFSIVGRKTYSNGRIASIGDCQSSEFILKVLTTGTTLTTVTTNNTTPSTTNQIILQNNNVFRFKGSIIGKQVGSTNVGVWDVDGVIVRGSSVSATTLVTSTVTSVTNLGGMVTPILSANTTNGGLLIQVGGLSATNIGWVVKIITDEIIY